MSTEGTESTTSLPARLRKEDAALLAPMFATSVNASSSIVFRAKASCRVTALVTLLAIWIRHRRGHASRFAVINTQYFYRHTHTSMPKQPGKTLALQYMANQIRFCRVMTVR